MKRCRRIFLLGFISFYCSTLQGQSIKDLDVLIGKWDHEETVFPGTEREYTEKGSRECSYVLEDTYIKCESRSNSPRGARTYWFLINYQRDKDHFKVTTYNSDFDSSWHYTWYLDKEQQKIHAISDTRPDAKQFFRSVLALSKDQLVWEGYRSRFREEMNWVLEFREISKRIE